jgi:Protein of unknown function (DUF5672)
MYTAIIIEPRKHGALSFVLNNFRANLSNEWNILILCGTENEHFCRDLARHLTHVDVKQLPFSNLTSNEYSAFCASKAFHDLIPTETFLIFQVDTLILNPLKLQPFLEYDYVGAPWDFMNGLVGNGGLSLRRKSKMIEVIEAVPFHGGNEDMYFCTQTKVPLNRPSKEAALEFSVETMYHPSPFGVHGLHTPRFNEIFQKLVVDYPQLAEWKQLNVSSGESQTV